MADRVYDEVSIKLQDNREVVLRPLVLKSLRRFMKEWERFSNMKEGDDSLDIFLDCCGICLEKNFKGDFDTMRGTDGEPLSEEYKAYLEDVLDMDTIYKILEVCAGMKLNDPELLAAAARAAAVDGQN